MPTYPFRRRPEVNPFTGKSRASNQKEAFVDDGPWLEVFIHVGGTLAKDLELHGQEPPQPITTKALICTANRLTIVSLRACCQLGLAPELRDPDRYRIYFALPETNIPPYDDLRVPGLDLGDVPYDMILGRDFLRRYRFTYDGPGGWFELSL